MLLKRCCNTQLGNVHTWCIVNRVSFCVWQFHNTQSLVRICFQALSKSSIIKVSKEHEKENAPNAATCVKQKVSSWYILYYSLSHFLAKCCPQYILYINSLLSTCKVLTLPKFPRKSLDLRKNSRTAMTLIINRSRSLKVLGFSFCCVDACKSRKDLIGRSAVFSTANHIFFSGFRMATGLADDF